MKKKLHSISYFIYIVSAYIKAPYDGWVLIFNFFIKDDLRMCLYNKILVNTD